MAKVIIMNGPPGVGKDTIASSLLKLGFANGIESFKAPVFEIAESMLGMVGYARFKKAYNDRACKERPCDAFGGLSPRQLMIHISESVIKPLFGDEYFGKRMVESINNGYVNGEVVVVPDGGFGSEITPLLRAGHGVIVVRLHRKGFTFEGDSRSYLETDDMVKAVDITLHDGDIEGAVKSVMEVIK